MRSIWSAGLLLIAHAAAAGDVEPTTYAGVVGARVVDSGTIVVTSVATSGREETFEYVRRPDGGTVLVQSITASDGRYRLQARYDFDAHWQAESAHGIGLYDGKPVAISLVKDGRNVRIAVDGAGIRLRPRAECDSCFLNLSPSALAMFVMTRHYDFAKGGEQRFVWAAQDLDHERTLSGGKDDITYRGERTLTTAAGPLVLRHFTFVERNPLPDGKTFVLNMDLWTDAELRPMAFRARIPGLSKTGTMGVRRGLEGLREQLASISDATVPLVPARAP